MNARTECEVEQMNSEYSMRVSEKAIIQFLDDYDPELVDGICRRRETVEHLLALNEKWKTNSVETVIRCINAVSEEVFKV